MKNKKKVNGYLNPELKGMEYKNEKPLPKIIIPKTMEECKNPAEQVACFCVMLFQTSGKPYEKPDPYDQTISIRRGRIIPNNRFDLDLQPRGEGACEAFERDLNAYENGFDMLNPDYADQWE